MDDHNKRLMAALSLYGPTISEQVGSAAVSSNNLAPSHAGVAEVEEELEV